jgi:hypothetical protein
MEDWKTDRVAEFISHLGRPVRVAVRDGATIQEIRPWRINKHAGHLGEKLGEIVDKVFSLGGAPPPMTARTVLGEAQLAQIERAYARRIGWSPDYQPSADLDQTMRSSASEVIVVNNGY